MKKTSWKDIAELIGILAIVASLVSVAFQLRQTQLALIASTYQARAFDAIAEGHHIADSEYLLPILVKTNHGENFDAVASLSEDDRTRLFHFLRARMIDWDNEHYQYQSGFLDAGFFEVTTKAQVRMWAPRWRAIGLTEGRGDFKEFVDSVLQEQDQVKE
jgi:hypothetical protein